VYEELGHFSKQFMQPSYYVSCKGGKGVDNERDW